MGYCVQDDFNRFLENFGSEYYGTQLNGMSISIATSIWQSDIDASFNRMNMLLDAVERIPIVPIGTSVRTGSYNPALIEWNVIDCIFTKMKSRHAIEYGDRLPQWMQDFGSRAREIYRSIIDGDISLDLDTTNKGIGYPVIIAKTGRAQFYSNWDTGFYSRSEYPVTYGIKIIGTTDGNLPGQSTFQLSIDNGYSWNSDIIITGTSWIGIDGGLKIRWENAGTLYGTQLQIELGDEYRITCIPVNVKSVHTGLKIIEMKRG